MTISILLQFSVVLGAIWLGARYSGVGLGEGRLGKSPAMTW